jgi:hypothetical protein
LEKRGWGRFSEKYVFSIMDSLVTARIGEIFREAEDKGKG